VWSVIFEFFVPVVGGRLRWEFGGGWLDKRLKIAVDDAKVTAYAKRDWPPSGERGIESRSNVKSAEVKETKDLKEENSGRLLEGGDGTVGVREGGLQVSEHLGLSGPARFAWKFGRRMLWQQSGANVGLTPIEAFPDPLQDSATQTAGV
jgi:hypothetical protein